MPAPAANLNKKFFSGDNSVSVLLGTFPLNVDTFSDGFAHGLVPQFFSSNRILAHVFLNQNPEFTKDLIATVNSRLLHMEHLSLEKAMDYLKPKKSKLAKGISAFPAPATTRKRSKPQIQDLTDSGTDHTQNVYHTVQCIIHFPVLVQYIE